VTVVLDALGSTLPIPIRRSSCAASAQVSAWPELKQADEWRLKHDGIVITNVQSFYGKTVPNADVNQEDKTPVMQLNAPNAHICIAPRKKQKSPKEAKY
jgi:hypothetical protein